MQEEEEGALEVPAGQVEGAVEPGEHEEPAGQGEQDEALEEL